VAIPYTAEAVEHSVEGSRNLAPVTFGAYMGHTLVVLRCVDIEEEGFRVMLEKGVQKNSQVRHSVVGEALVEPVQTPKGT
jgi:hypothetical protein